MQEPSTSQETVFFAHATPDIVVIRVVGRGSHQNSPSLQEVAADCLKKNPRSRFILDLENCPTMDSTFMGAMAGIAIQQAKAGQGKTIVVNLGDQAFRLLQILGLVHMLDVRKEIEVDKPLEEEFKIGESPELSKLERTAHMIQAHEQLVGLDSENEVKFEGVLQYLRESLDRERERQGIHN